MTAEPVGAAGGPPTGAGADRADRAELRQALLTRPTAVSSVAAVVVSAGSAVLDDHRLAAAVSGLVAAAVVIGCSAITGLLGVRTATARAEAVFAAAMASFAIKVLVFGIALGFAGHVDGVRRTSFAVTAIVAVLVWLAVEVRAVGRLQSTGAVVFGPPPPVPGPGQQSPGRTGPGAGGGVGGSPGIG